MYSAELYSAYPDAKYILVSLAFIYATNVNSRLRPRGILPNGRKAWNQLYSTRCSAAAKYLNSPRATQLWRIGVRCTWTVCNDHKAPRVQVFIGILDRKVSSGSPLDQHSGRDDCPQRSCQKTHPLREASCIRGWWGMGKVGRVPWSVSVLIGGRLFYRWWNCAMEQSHADRAIPECQQYGPIYGDDQSVNKACCNSLAGMTWKTDFTERTLPISTILWHTSNDNNVWHYPWWDCQR